MTLLVPQIGEVESLRYLVGANNHVTDLQDTSPRNLLLKLYRSDTTPTDESVPCLEHYFEPYVDSASSSYGEVVATGYPTCINNRTDQDYTNNYGILLNGSRWTIRTTGTATTSTYPEQTFTFSSQAGPVYGYYVARAQNMPRNVQGVQGVGLGTAGTSWALGNDTDPTIGILGNLFVTIDQNIGIGSITVGMAATHLALPTQQIGIQTGSIVVGIDRATQQIYLDKALEANIQVATGSTVRFDYTQIAAIDRTSGLATDHGLQPGDVIYIGRDPSVSGITSGTYTVHTIPTTTSFTTTPAMAGVGTCTLYPSIFYSERFTNGPYNIQNNGDQIKVTLNVSLE
jgi:hypothetical protein